MIVTTNAIKVIPLFRLFKISFIFSFAPFLYFSFSVSICLSFYYTFCYVYFRLFNCSKFILSLISILKEFIKLSKALVFQVILNFNFVLSFTNFIKIFLRKIYKTLDLTLT